MTQCSWRLRSLPPLAPSPDAGVAKAASIMAVGAQAVIVRGWAALMVVMIGNRK